MTEPIRLAVFNDYEVIVAGVAGMLAPFPDRVRVVELDVRDFQADTPVDIALFDTYGRACFAEEPIIELVHDDMVSKVVVYTHWIPPAEVTRSLALGAAGCLSKALRAER